MGTDSRRRLLDLLLRHQVYLDGVKAGLTADYAEQLRGLYEDFIKFLIRNMRYDSMDQMTKMQLAALLRQFQQAQTAFYDEYAQSLVTTLNQLTAADVDVTSAIFKNAIGIEPDVNVDRVFSTVLNDPIPANGLLLGAYIGSTINTAKGAVIATLRKGYANAWTFQDVVAALEGSGSRADQFGVGLYSRFLAQNGSMLSTALQHITANVTSAASDDRHYQWVSVMDDVTTPVCRERNGNVYEFGKGPLPPANYNCRSRVVPVPSDQPIVVAKSLQSWLKNQPEAFQNDIQVSRDGKIVPKPLTLAQFRNKIQIIIKD